MRLYLFPPSSRALGVVALKNYLALDCELEPIDLGRGDQRSPGYVVLNPNRKQPTLDDDGFVLWESNAILTYLAAQRPERGLWPADVRRQADVVRWLCWQSAHWDAESCGMVAFEKASKVVLGLGAPDPAFIARGEANFLRFAAVLDEQLATRTWIAGEKLTIADFSIGALVPSAERMGLPIAKFIAIGRWYRALAALPAWQDALAAQTTAMAAWFAKQRSFAVSIELAATPHRAFECILDVAKWWGGNDLAGNVDEFTITHGDVHYSKQTLVELVPDRRVVWCITESRLNWLARDKHEWTNTRLVFELSATGVLHFTHEGLVPELECYAMCSDGWSLVIKDYLFNFITAGTPHFS